MAFESPVRAERGLLPPGRDLGICHQIRGAVLLIIPGFFHPEHIEVQGVSMSNIKNPLTMFFYVLREFLEMTLIHLALCPQTPDESRETHDHAKAWPSGRKGQLGIILPALPLLRSRSELQLPRNRWFFFFYTVI